jgi:4'-phosphopantetheinyl transferase
VCSKLTPSGAALAEDTIEVWLLSVPPGPTDAGLDLLDSHERSRWGKFHFDRDRRLYGCAHALLRVALSHYAPVNPCDWRFEAGPFGRPELASAFAGLDLRFNLSHTRGLAACVIARNRAVGIDVELLDTPADLSAIAQSYFTRCECAQISAAPSELKSEVFLSIWTLKEAYLKARGVGLAVPLRSFSVSVAPPRIRPAFDDCWDWYASLSRENGCYLVALAIPRVCRDEAPNLLYRRFEAPWFDS